MAEEDKTTSIEAAILRAKREWETIFDAVSDMLFLVDSSGIILRSNKTAAEKIGMTYVDLLGKNKTKGVGRLLLVDLHRGANRGW
jgi:PAS domain S-box-containing protein